MLSSGSHQCTALLAALHPNPTCQPPPLWWNTFWMCDFSNGLAISCSVPGEHPTVPVYSNCHSDNCHNGYFCIRPRENQKTQSIRIRPRSQHEVLHSAPMALSNTGLPAPANASVPANQRHSVYNDLILIMEKVSTPPSLHLPAVISCNPSIPTNVKALPGSAIKLSLNGSEYHAFANIPESEGRSGSSVIISRAVNWTSSGTDKVDQYQQTLYWLRGGPAFGVITLARLFKRVILVATGTGIAPMLSLLGSGISGQYHIFWSCKNPFQTYGIRFVLEVMDLDKDVVIFNTTIQNTRPKLVETAQRMYRSKGAEAVFVVSNRPGKEKTVEGLQALGRPAYGPIFDA
jgi:hypothetical protein